MSMSLSSPGPGPDTGSLSRADARLYVDVVVDTEQGSRLDPEMAKQIRELMAETEWRVLESGQLQLSKNNQPVLVALYFTNQEKTLLPDPCPHSEGAGEWRDV